MRTLSVYFLSFVIMTFAGGCAKPNQQNKGQAHQSESLTYTESKIESLERRLERINAELAKKKYKLGKLNSNSDSKVVERAEIQARIKSLDEERHYISKELKYLRKIQSQP